MLGGQQAWDAYAAKLNAKMELMQLHVEPDWLFCLCTSCGWSLELGGNQRPVFRRIVAAHECSLEEIPEAAPVPVLADVLF